MGGEGCSFCYRPYSAPYTWTEGGERMFCDLAEHVDFWETEANYARREIRVLQEALTSAYETIRKLRKLSQ